jgi:hypothetical protein
VTLPDPYTNQSQQKVAENNKHASTKRATKVCVKRSQISSFLQAHVLPIPERAHGISHFQARAL